MDRNLRGKSRGMSSTLAVLMVVGAGLYIARQILIPVALTMLVMFLLAPIVRRVERLGIGRVGAVLLVVGLGVGCLGAVGWVVEDQAYQVASQLPEYKENIQAKLKALRLSRGSVLDRASTTLAELGREMAASGAEKDLPRLGQGGTRTDPVAVKVVETPPTPFEYARSLIGPAIGPATTAAIVVVLSAFTLARREDLRDRLVILMGERTMHLSTPALDDAAQRVSQYLFLQTAVNSSVGLIVGLGLLAIGVPGALLWGFLTAVLRFVPYVGTWIAGAFPFVITLAVSPDWKQPMLTLGMIAAVELLAGQLVEPLLFSSRTGLSSVAILASTLFWTWLWGPVGLLLSTPLTVCVAVLGRHIPRLGFLEVLLADRIELPLQSRLYQRLLAGDQEEGVQIVQTYSVGKTLAEVYDSLVLPTMRLAEGDRHRNELGEDRAEELREALGVIVADQDHRGNGARQGAAAPPQGRVRAVCVPARDAMDGLSAEMLAQVLRESGTEARALSSDYLTGEVLEYIVAESPEVVCVCAVPPDASVHARVLCKRIRAVFPKVALVVGLWNSQAEMKDAVRRLGDVGTEYIATTLAQAAATVPQLATTDAAAAAAPKAA